MEDVKYLKIAIVGLGLIGGSILKVLNNKGFYTIAVSKSSCSAASKIADVTSCDYEVLKEADVVFVCSKMCDTLEILDKLEDIVSENTIVCDVCSLKEFVNKKHRPYKFIGTHPMAGTEFSGFEHSFKELFYGAKWVINQENETLEYLIKLMGAKPLLMSPKEHDIAASEISHFPMLLSFALFNMTSDNAKKMASSGFRDTTRLAATNVDLAYDMLNFNSENINFCIEEFIKSLKNIKNLSDDSLKNLLLLIAKERHSMYDEAGKNRL